MNNIILADYRLEYLDKLKVDEGDVPQEYIKPKTVLFLKYKRIFELYQLHGKKVGETLLPKNSLDYYLVTSNAYLGKKRSVRFKNIIKGIQTTETEMVNGYQTPVEQSTIDQAYCFDYELLQEQYGINLEVSTTSIYSDLPSDKSAEPSAPTPPPSNPTLTF